MALAALTLCAGVAQAQSSVTLYGVLDSDVASTTTAGVVGTGATATIKSISQTQVRTDGLSGNRWGLRGREELGGGLGVIFNIESGFNVDAGSSSQGGVLFGRRANMGLTGGFGKVELGRNSSPYDDVAADHSMMGMSSFDPSNYNTGPSTLAAAAVLDPAALAKEPGMAAIFAPYAIGPRVTTWLGYGTRFNNSIKYSSPNLNGLTASVLYAFGEDATASLGASQSVSAHVKFVNGSWLVSAGYQSEAAAASVTATTAPALQNTLLSVVYDFGVAKAGMGFNRAAYKDVTVAATGVAFAAQTGWDLSVAVPLGVTTLSCNYAMSDGDTLGQSRGFGVQALYALSKRTTLYVGGVSTQLFDKLVAAAPVGSDIQRNSLYAAGVRHTF